MYPEHEASEKQSGELLELLGEAKILAVLNVAEAVRTKVDSIRGLKRLIGDIVARETQLEIEQITGLIVAEQLHTAGRCQTIKQELIELHKSDIAAFSWPTLLSEAGKA